MQIERFDETCLAQAAALGADHMRGLAEILPLLPTRYTRAETLLELLRPAADQGHGVVALNDGELLGYMADVRFGFKEQQAAMSLEWAHATVAQHARRIHEALYTGLSRHWVADGRALHLMSWTPNDKAGQEAWRWQGFGLLGVDAVRDLTPIERTRCAATIRRATGDDAHWLQEMGRGLWCHLAASPVFLAGHDEPLSSWRGKLAAADRYYALAEMHGDPLGFVCIGPASHNACTLIRDAGTASITGAYLAPEARGQGIADALLDACLNWAREQGGFVRCAVDFESANLPGARFWLRHFQPIVYTGMRYVDPRMCTPPVD